MDAEKLSQLTQKVIGDAAGAVGLLLAYIGDQSKVYTTMDELGLVRPLLYRLLIGRQCKQVATPLLLLRHQ